jgi:hypothetical protein
MPSSTDVSAAICFFSTWSSEVCSRTRTLSNPPALANWLGGGPATISVRDSRRASRSGGATKITVSLIGEGFGVPWLAAAPSEVPRCGVARIDPVTSGIAPSAVARDSSAV